MIIKIPKAKEEKIVRTTSTLELDWQTICACLQEAGIIPARLTGSDNLEVYVRVPGGGDWSNTNLSLVDHPIVVKITKETRSEV